MFGWSGAVIVDHMLEVRTAGIAGAPARKVYPMVRDRRADLGTELGVSGCLAKRSAAFQEVLDTGDKSLMFCADADKGHAAALVRFAEQVRGGPEVCPVDAAVDATLVAFAAVRSARENRPVTIQEVREQAGT